MKQLELKEIKRINVLTSNKNAQQLTCIDVFFTDGRRLYFDSQNRVHTHNVPLVNNGAPELESDFAEMLTEAPVTSTDLLKALTVSQLSEKLKRVPRDKRVLISIDDLKPAPSLVQVLYGREFALLCDRNRVNTRGLKIV